MEIDCPHNSEAGANNDAEPQDLPIDLSKAEDQAAGLIADLGEVALDSFLREGLAKDIPVVGSVFKLFYGGRTVRDILFVRKLARFVQSAPLIDAERREEFRKKLQADRHFAQRTSTHLVTVLDRLEELEKATLLARIFAAYVGGSIDQSQMRRLANILERALLVDLVALRNYLKDLEPLTVETFYGLESVGLASTYHSIVRPILPGELLISP